jgi:aldehyde:ferredoxin oxidoreductase
MIYDMIGVCEFAAAGLRAEPEITSSLVNALLGVDTRDSDLRRIALECLSVERDFNRRAGFSAAHDRIPGFMLRDPLPPQESVFDIAEGELDSFWEDTGPTEEE